jgi:hypothetical protein
MILEVAGSFEITDKCGYNCTLKLKCCIYNYGYGMTFRTWMVISSEMKFSKLLEREW